MVKFLRGILGVLIFIAIIGLCWTGAAQLATYLLPEELWIIIAAGGMFVGVGLAFEFAKYWWSKPKAR